MLVHVLAALLARIAVQREQIQALFVLHVVQELTAQLMELTAVVHVRLAYKGIIVQAQQALPHHVLLVVMALALDQLQCQIAQHVQLEHTVTHQQQHLSTHALVA